MVPKTLEWKGSQDGYLHLIDQRVLPGKVEYLKCGTVSELYEAIQTLAVRGAPAIGVSAAYGVCICLREYDDDSDLEGAVKHIEKNADYLATSRPTAVNLFRALDRMKKEATENEFADVRELKEHMLECAHEICREDEMMCEAIGQNGKRFIPEGGGVLTHCNAGALATAGIGTALAPMYAAHEEGVKFKVYADETRPLLQGGRLTAWELSESGIDVSVICDNSASMLFCKSMIDAVITGADRIAANGDSANKIGTCGLSILARHFGVPFYIAAPSSTFDLSIESGDEIPIEQRSGDEVKCFGGTLTVPAKAGAVNFAFDVTRAENITAIITEKGIIESPDADKIRDVLG